MSWRDLWESATARAIAVTTIIGLFGVYLLKTWKRAGVDKAMHRQRVKTMADYERQRETFTDQTVEEINKFETDFQTKMQQIDIEERSILIDAARSRKKLSDAINRSFGR